MAKTAKTNRRSDSDSDSDKKKNKELNFESLANRFRPKTLDDLVGQDAIVAQIRGMFATGRVPPVFMITGDSGVGKTTTSRMIARYLNCSNRDPKTHDPCGECDNCKYDINHPDFLELNAADSRGIDDMRNLIQSAKNMPSVGKYRIILLDEAHRLTDAAAPILLKPLEDPPRRTVWILATTNPEKLPSTILGRCHPLTLKPIEQEVIVKRLNKIARKMGTDFKEMDEGMKVLKTIANFSEGRMRNAIQMLDIALLAIASGEAVDTKSLIARYVTTEEAQLEKQSVGMVVSVLAGDLKSLTRSIRKGGAQPRGLMYKARFLIQYLLDEYAGVAKYVPYSGRLFAEAAKASSVKPNPIKLMQLQYRLIEIEQRMNTMSLDESIQLLASLGALIREEK